MKKNNTAAWIRNIAAFCLMVTVFVSTSMIALAKPGNSLAGEIIVSGHKTNGVEPAVMLNGERISSGRTFFESGVISTSETASATIKLGKLGYINLTPDSSISLTFSENNISGTILSGDASVFNNEGVTVNIENAKNNAANNQQTTGKKKSILLPILIFGAIVGVAAAFVLTNDNDEGIISGTR
ncbi:MAG: hypothetical protein WA584_13780 [Pyrinomonadaceae bacterium]